MNRGNRAIKQIQSACRYQVCGILNPVVLNMISLARFRPKIAAKAAVLIAGLGLMSALADRFTSTVTGFLDLVEAAKHYPCARTAWIEFLGEANPGRVQVPT